MTTIRSHEDLKLENRFFTGFYYQIFSHIRKSCDERSGTYHKNPRDRSPAEVAAQRIVNLMINTKLSGVKNTMSWTLSKKYE